MVGIAKLYLPDARSIRLRIVQRIRFLERIIVQRIRFLERINKAG
jgi:hypothetical protein